MNEAVDNTAATSFRPGTWFGVLGDHVAVFLPPSVKDRVAPLWELVDGGAGFDELLDALIAGGLRSLPGFLILSRGEEATRVLVRGTPRAVFVNAAGETTEVDGADTTTWTERTISDVVSSTLLLEGTELDPTDEPPHQHLVAGGLVRVARVDHPPYVVTPVPVEQPVWEAPVERPSWTPPADALGPLSTGNVSLPSEVETAAPFEAPAPETWSAPATELEDDVAAAAPDEGVEPESTVAFEPFTPGAEAAVTDTPLSPAVDSWPAPDPSEAPPPLSVGSWHSPDSEGPFAPPAVTEQVPSDHDGQTLGSSWDPSQFARPQPGIPGQPPAPSVTARPVARLHFAHGEVIDVDRAVLVGRAPEARRFTSTDQPRLVTVPSPNQEISSTHLEVRPGSGADHGTAVVTDLGSTNGTVLVLPGLGPQTLQPGVAVQLLPGALIDLGDGMTVQVSGI